MAEKTVHLVCQAHLDPVWLWEWEEGAAEVMSTFRTAADLCEAFDGFIFNHNEVVLYQWVEEYEPELFARIQRLVAQGRWHIIGGWYLQPDANMPSGESFVRQALTGRHYFLEKFGVVPTCAVNFDPFGHTRGLVQILAKSGYDSYLFCRPGQGDCPLPADEFDWIGFDGSRVRARRVANGYNSPLGQARAKVERIITASGDAEQILVLWGVGDHGGGPSRKDLDDLGVLISECPDADIRHSTPEAYFAATRQSTPSVPAHEKDLNPWAVGCYTSQVRVKQMHRRLENELFVTEKMLTTAVLQGLLEYPSEDLKRAQQDLLFAEFHDILPGSSIQPVEETSIRLMSHGLEILSRLKARAFFRLASGQPTAREGEIPVLVYNPHPYPVEEAVECEFQLADQNWEDSFTVPQAYAGSEAIPTQVEKELSNLNLDWRKRIVFQTVLKPGMNRFDCRLQRVSQRPVLPLPDPDGYIRFDNGRLQVVIGTATGLIERFQVDGIELMRPGACRPVVIADNEDPWGMRVRAFRTVAGEFRLMSPERCAAFSGLSSGKTLPPVRIIEDGPVRTVVEVCLAFADSAMCLQYVLPRRGTGIEVKIRVFWAEKNRMLKLSIPTPWETGTYMGQVAYGRQVLPANGDEAVSQKWNAVVSEDGTHTLICINSGSYGSDFCAGEWRLTLLRSPAYSGHPIKDRPVVPEDRFIPRQDQGERLFSLYLTGGAAKPALEAVERLALSRNEVPMALSFFPGGSGSLPVPGVVLDDTAVVLTAFKQAENGDGVIMRLFEPTGQDRQVQITLPALKLSRNVLLGPFEIKTFRLDVQHGVLLETDLMEGLLDRE